MAESKPSAAVAVGSGRQRAASNGHVVANGRVGVTDTSARSSVTPSRLADTSPAIESITVVVPCHNEEGNLPVLHERLTTVLDAQGMPYEIIIIDDGSTDGTWATITDLNRGDQRVIGLRHRRNFGKAEALANGFAVARGDVIITMDGDLQDDPDELPHFLTRLDEGYDLVSGWKQRRKDPLGKTFPSKIFNWTVRRASGVPLHDFNCGFKAYRREAAKNLRLYGELHRFTPVLASAEGFRVGELPVKHHPRTWGQSKYGWSRLVKGFLDLMTVTFLTQYRQRPMHLFGLPGLIGIAMGVMLGLWLSADKILTDSSIGNRPALLLSVLLIVIGTQFFGLGLLGEFLTHGSNAPRSQLHHQVQASVGLGVNEVRVAAKAPAGVESMTMDAVASP
ncbi:MAG: Glycosyltransferase [uncultured Thermomicrobiales bacterium]|uniref:Glycosyltransferase n=1 Tax=uncultured Thermomicrobiales bacterium TaxID=1645740 RepID=A0A6J4VDX6_9BACT|nr:MAG: Glycosyltransferase [uncultured Thermomicrobiales bacterium]